VKEPPKPSGFVSLKSLKHGPRDASSVLAELRHIYFKTTKRTIEHDFDHAIELLKSLATEDEREKATVFMEGIAQMRREWALGRTGETEETGSHGGTGKRRRTGKRR
jgi:hypothetical protein